MSSLQAPMQPPREIKPLPRVTLYPKPRVPSARPNNYLALTRAYPGIPKQRSVIDLLFFTYRTRISSSSSEPKRASSSSSDEEMDLDRGLEDGSLIDLTGLSIDPFRLVLANRRVRQRGQMEDSDDEDEIDRGLAKRPKGKNRAPNLDVDMSPTKPPTALASRFVSRARQQARHLKKAQVHSICAKDLAQRVFNVNPSSFSNTTTTADSPSLSPSPSSPSLFSATDLISVSPTCSAVSEILEDDIPAPEKEPIPAADPQDAEDVYHPPVYPRRAVSPAPEHTDTYIASARWRVRYITRVTDEMEGHHCRVRANANAIQRRVQLAEARRQRAIQAEYDREAELEKRRRAQAAREELERAELLRLVAIEDANREERRRREAAEIAAHHERARLEQERACFEQEQQQRFSYDAPQTRTLRSPIHLNSDVHQVECLLPHYHRAPWTIDSPPPPPPFNAQSDREPFVLPAAQYQASASSSYSPSSLSVISSAFSPTSSNTASSSARVTSGPIMVGAWPESQFQSQNRASSPPLSLPVPIVIAAPAPAPAQVPINNAYRENINIARRPMPVLHAPIPVRQVSHQRLFDVAAQVERAEESDEDEFEEWLEDEIEANDRYEERERGAEGGATVIGAMRRWIGSWF